jgi:hypothetical protein
MRYPPLPTVRRRWLPSLLAATLLFGTLAAPAVADVPLPDDEPDPDLAEAVLDVEATVEADVEADVAADIEADDEALTEDVTEDVDTHTEDVEARADAVVTAPVELEQHCPGSEHGAPPGAIEGASGTTTVEGIIVTWGGDPGVVTFTNPTELDATVSWCAKGGTDFAADGSKTLGVQFTEVPADGLPVQEGPFGTEISYLVVYDVEFHEPPPPPDEPITIELVKRWFDVDGAPVETPSGVDWGLELYVGADTEPSVTLPGDDATVELDLLTGPDGPAPARYGVQEAPAPEGWEAVHCDTVQVGDLTWVNEGTSAMLVASGADSGAFGAMESGIHLVCNQQLEEEEPPAPEPVTIGLTKVWLDEDGAVEEAPDAPFAVTLQAAETVLVTVDETTPATVSTELPAGSSYVVAEPTLPEGWELADCPAGLELEGIVATGVGTFTASAVEGASGLHVVCNQPIVEVLPTEPIEKPEPPAPPTPTERPTPVVTPTVRPAAPAAEVLGVTLERAALPKTGAGLAGLAGFAVLATLAGGATLALTRERRRTLR